jgi:fumarate reductase subunit C
MHVITKTSHFSNHYRFYFSLVKKLTELINAFHTGRDDFIKFYDFQSIVCIFLLTLFQTRLCVCTYYHKTTENVHVGGAAVQETEIRVPKFEFVWLRLSTTEHLLWLENAVFCVSKVHPRKTSWGEALYVHKQPTF